MKPVARCKGCGKKKLLNHLELCKRCNRESSKHVTEDDLARLRREADFVRQAKLRDKKAAAPEEEKVEGEEEAKDKDKKDDKVVDKKVDKKEDRKKGR